jgi:hypothetical protein
LQGVSGILGKIEKHYSFRDYQGNQCKTSIHNTKAGTSLPHEMKAIVQNKWRIYHQGCPGD